METSRGKAMILLLLLAASLATGQSQCNNLTETEVSNLLREEFPIGDGSQVVINSIDQWTVNCLVTAGALGKYSEATFTASFYYNNRPDRSYGQADMFCENNAWQSSQNLDILSVDQFTSRINAQRVDCHRCSRAAAPANEVTHCVACNSACNQGTTFCTGSGAGDCCSYFNNSLCVTQCGTNQHPDSSNICTCDSFYTGLDCSNCSIQCLNNGVANETSCSCNCGSTGYIGATCSVDVDECTDGTNQCTNGGSCVNTNGSYTCECPPGFTDSNCQTDIDDCQSGPCMFGNCTDRPNSYTCQCSSGYTGENCDTDVDDCQPNPCQRGGSCTDEGVNSFSCRCPPGFTGGNCGTDINECTESTPCLNGGSCTNNDGGFSCRCQGGWMGDLCQTCNVSDCLRPVCNGSDVRCEQCVTGYSIVNNLCVTCNVKDCQTCSAKDICSSCIDTMVLSDDGRQCNPMIVTEAPTRGRSAGINSGAIIGIVAALIVVLITIAIIIAVVIVILGKVNRDKPPTYNVKTPKPEDKDIILTKISNI